MPSLVERRHRQTRAEIAATAVMLFTRDGYDETTMDDIAAEAGVSRRTAYRHFPEKADLVFEHPRLWLEHFDGVIANRTTGESVRGLCRRGLLEVAELIQADAEGVFTAWQVVLDNPSLRGRMGKAQDEWHSRYVELITAETGDAPDALLATVLMAGTLVATTNSLVAVWALQYPSADMPSLTRAALGHVDSLWPPECRS